MSGDWGDDFGATEIDEDFDFDAVAEANAAPTRSFDVIPAGWYRAIITDTVVKQTKSGNGRLLEATIELLDNEHDGRKVWHRFNFENANEKAQEIGRRELGQAAKAAGLPTLKSHRELIDKPLQVNLAIDNWNGEKRNVVKGWKPA